MNNNKFLDFVTLLSLVIGVYAFIVAIQNLEENRKQTDDTKEILKKLDGHLSEQDKLLGGE